MQKLPSPWNDEKAQLHTLEGIAASTLLLLVIVYAIDATSMTPLTSTTANAHVETELATIGQDILNSLDYAEPGYNSRLKNDILKWNGKTYVLWDGANYSEFGNVTSSNYLINNLTNISKLTLVKHGIAHNVEITFVAINKTSLSTQKMIDNGQPSDNAVIVSRKIVFHDSDAVYLSITNPIKEIDTSSELRNVVDIKLILWRT